MTRLYFLFVFLSISIQGISQEKMVNLKKIINHIYVHESFLQTNEWGKVSCNGMVFINKKEAIVFDTPANDADALQLINLITDSLKAKVIGVVINHFHNDCLGGLKAFHQRNVPSYASFKTIALARENNIEVPKNGFDKSQTLMLGNQKIENLYFGAAHTQDNIVSFIPSEKVLFGGCMVKALKATKGFLGDADVTEWPKTIEKVKALKPKIVIPGHGEFGGPDLLDYTKTLFKN